MAEKVLGDNSFEWKILGRYNKPTYMIGGSSATQSGSLTATANGATDGTVVYVLGDNTTSGYVGNFLRKFDMVRFQSGATALVLEDPILNTTASGAATDYQIKLQMVIPSGGQALTDADVAAGAIVASIGSAFPNGSDGADVGENHVLPETHKNYLTIMRKKTSITGKDATDVTWIENNGHRLWYFTREQMLMDEFMYQ